MDADPLWGPCESDMALGSPHGTDESVKVALDTACGTATMAVEGYAIVLTAGWDTPDVSPVLAGIRSLKSSRIFR